MATKKTRGERKLPVQQLTILAICRFAEPIASTSLYPYLPEMVASFDVPQNEIGKWAGLCAATFSLTQAVMGIPWGRFSDVYGRKPAILMGLTFTMLTSLMWGFSKNLPMAIAARALAGAVNGNVGIIRTAVAEMVPYKELQPRAFSIMPLVWNIGSIFGPSIGGALANPFNVRPGENRSNPSLLEVFPFALPNIVAATIFATGIAVGVLYLHESLESRKHRRDFGLILGQGLNRLLRRLFSSLLAGLRLRSQTGQEVEEPLAHETVQLLKADDAESNQETAREITPRLPPPTLREILNPQAVMNLVVYTALAMHSMAYDQVLPVFMQHAPLSGPSSTPFTPPLRFAGGFGLKSYQIGILNTCIGVFAMVMQFGVFPPLARKYGVLRCMKVVACIYPIAYALTPFTVLFPTEIASVTACFGLMMVKCIAGVFAFPCTTILLTNSASSMRTLATLNGAATMFSAVGRAAGPAIAGAVFSVGVKRGYVIAPFWVLCAISILATVPIFWLVEGEGFGVDNEVSDDEGDDADEEVIAAGSSAQRVPTTRGEQDALLLDDATLDAIMPESLAESAGEPGSLAISAHESMRRNGIASSPTPAARSLPSQSRKESYLAASSAIDEVDDLDDPIDSRARSNDPIIHRATRRFHSPIGMGEHGVSRRYSSNLGQNLGGSGHLGGP